MLTFFVATSFTYAYFDNLTTNQFETVPLGDWRGEAGSGFENYTGGSTLKIDGKTWNLTNIIVGNSSTDNYNGTQSLRLQQNSSFTSADSYTGATSISFYYSQVTNGFNNPHNLTLTAIINGTVTVYLINNQPIPKTWTQASFDLSYFYTTGVNGVVYPKATTEVTFSFNFVGHSNPKGDLNLDDLIILCE